MARTSKPVRAIPVRTIEVRRVRSAHPKACPDQWDVLIPLRFCHRKDALRYARHMAAAGNRMNPQLRTVVQLPKPSRT